jgi:uncharacterized protein (TIGR02145 family)
MKSIKTKTNKTSNLAIFSGSLLVVASAVMFFAPVIRTNAAEESVDVTVNVNPIVSLSLDKSALNFNITPTSAGVFDSGSIVATVDTNSTGGYELYFSSEDSGTALTSLVSESTITSDFNSAVTSSSMSANKWGYSLDATNFNKIPTLADQVKIKDLDHYPISSEKDTTVTIGTKIDSTLPSGVYSKKVVFTTIAHPNPTPTLHNITSMQQMSADICTETTTPSTAATFLDWDGSHHGDNTYVPRKSLRDSRDGKYYLVSKLADGNCWMSQNLEFMLDSTVTLTSDTTDLNTKTTWKPENSTLTTMPTSTTWPTNIELSSSSAHSYYPVTSSRYYRGGSTKSNSPTESGVKYDWEKAGVYYNWYAATAGSSAHSTFPGTVNDSICPRGWRLPLGTYDSKSFYYLFDTIYRAAHVQPTYLVDIPFNLVHAGILNGHTDSMSNDGIDGNLWSSTAYSQFSPYSLRFGDNAGLYVQDGANSNHGYNVRCVAR